MGAGLIDKQQQNCWKNERSMTCTDSLIEMVKLTKLRLSFPMKAKSHQRNPPVTGQIQPMKRWLHVLHATEQSVKQIRTMPATKMDVSFRCRESHMQTCHQTETKRNQSSSMVNPLLSMTLFLDVADHSRRFLSLKEQRLGLNSHQEKPLLMLVDLRSRPALLRSVQNWCRNLRN